MSLFFVSGVAYAQESPHGKIRFECTTCHGTETWKVTQNKFKHEGTGFALNGRHQSVQCENCHKGLKFAKQPSNCLSCHTDVHKSELGTNCLRCHSAASWKISDMVQKHQSTRFPLLGKHATLNCQSCHANAAQKQYSGISTDCFSCHRSDFNRALRPNHAASGFPMNCAQCHTVTSQRWDGWFVHEKKILAAPTECVSCHRTDFVATRTPSHTSAGFPTECKTCHQSTVQWLGARFNHGQTRFPLIGAHTPLQCQNCHSDNVFAGKPSDCMSCHRPDYNRVTNPNHVAGNFPTNCLQCHTQTSYRPATFNHSLTRFQLTGAHQATNCAQCHPNGQFTGAPTTCVGCHQTNFNTTTNPNHRTLNFGTNCQQCHSTTNWRSTSFDHTTTQFALTGRHATAQCTQCHVNNNYQLVFNSNCQQCHQTQFNQPTNPRHVAPSFGQNCAPCHNTTLWRPSSFNHATTRFPLTGRHIGRACNDCHRNDVYRNLPGTCWDCHSNDFNRTTDPNHVQRNFSHDCTQCHSTSGWGGASFDHSTTTFPLTGAHVPLQCVQCHVGGNYQLVFNNNCKQCHESDYLQPTSPRHVLPSFGQNCTPCHSTTVWRPSTFSHVNTTFPLVGAHQTVTCNQCHVNNQYQLPHTCWDCHATRFNQTTNPNHQQGQFSHDCTQCHTQAAWNPASFSHANSPFPLTGAHVPLQCVQCHVNGNYQIRFNNDCKQCHEADYLQPTNPRHVLPSFGQNCAPCHNTSVWRPSTFSHTNTRFPLTGAHQATACNQCHVNSVYRDLPLDCNGCHANGFNGTTNPNHVARSFSRNCTQCHTTTAWSPASYDHGTSGFPLTGRHTTATCVSCHVSGNYNLTYNDCYQCHQTDYTRPTNPNHVTLQLSHNCERCHTTNVWRPSTYNHDVQYFRIYSGRHNGRWNNNCSSCHPTLGQYQIFTCTTACHPQGEMNNQHRNIQNYRYESSACYSCHRND